MDFSTHHIRMNARFDFKNSHRMHTYDHINTAQRSAFERGRAVGVCCTPCAQFTHSLSTGFSRILVTYFSHVYKINENRLDYD